MNPLFPDFPSQPGTYALVMLADKASTISAGALGRLRVRPGWYVYVGSAYGPGGPRSRLLRHLRSTICHWHVDYLKPQAPVVEIWTTTNPVPQEHLWARLLHNMPGAEIPWPGFGSSGCRCRAHLVYLPAPPGLTEFRMIGCQDGSGEGGFIGVWRVSAPD
jgi:Uri superfamily endonuclease